MLQHKYQRRYNPVFHHSLCFFISCCILAILAIPTTATAKASSSTNKNLYTTLSLSKSASPKEITKAYRKLALKYHPDKVKPEERQEAERQFKEIGYAHDILSDEEKRKRYDLYGEQGLDENFQPGGMGDMGGSFGNNMGGMNMNDIFQQMNHGKGANRRRQQQQHQQQQKQQFYNNGTGGSGAGREGGVQIDLNEILQEFMMSGGPSTRSSPGRRQKRGGFGTASSGPFGDMGMGMGMGMDGRNPMFGQQNPFQQQQQQQQHQKPQHQHQRGEYSNQSKPQIQPFYCTLNELSNENGSTKKLKVQLPNNNVNEKIYTIHIQPGWKDGTKIKFKATKDGMFPPMTFVLKEKKHAYLKRSGDDLIYVCVLTASQARKGVKIKIPLPMGETLEIITQPDEISKGYRKSVSGKGMPRRTKNESHATHSSSSSISSCDRGDLIVHFKIKEES